MTSKTTASLLILSLIALCGAGTALARVNSVSVPAAEITWAPVPGLPLKIAPLWGNMKKGRSGFLLQIPAGDKGLLHTHKADYYGVVIKGTVINAQKGEQNPKPMGPGSHWRQARNKAHTTSCSAGEGCLIYVHFDAAFNLAPVKAKTK